MKRRSEEERREMVKDLLSGRYMVLDTKEKLRIGAALLMGGIPKKDIPDIAMVLGDMNSRLGSRVCNGIPMFTTITTVHREDWRLIANAYNKELKHLDKIEV